MKKLLLLGAALLGLCAVGQTTARAGDDGPVYNERPAPRYYEGEVVRPRCYLPPPPVYYAPAPVVYGYPRPYYRHRRFYRPYAYGYGYGYVPGIHIGIGF